MGQTVLIISNQFPVKIKFKSVKKNQTGHFGLKKVNSIVAQEP
jgi:hypothetical protein